MAERVLTGEQEVHGGVRRVMAAIAILVVLLFAGSLAWLYTGGSAPDGPIPVIRAPEGAVKVAPADVGGMEVPNRDKKVFQAMTGQSVPIEPKLADGPEDPFDMDALEQGRGKPMAAQATREPLPLPEPRPDALAPATAPDTAPNTAPERASDRAAVAEPPERAPANPLGDPFAEDAWTVQLAAFTRSDQALTYWDGLMADHPDLLQGLRHYVMTTKRRGTDFFRLRAGPLPDKASAARLCAAMEQVGRGCLAVAPRS